jgi:hypothetical protein
MFDLKKDIEKFQGITPYASEHYGVYRPLLGWESGLTKKWIRLGSILIDPRVKQILDHRLLPGPKGVLNPHPLEFIASPLEPASGKSPFKVLLTNTLNSELLKIVLARVQTFVEDHNGKLPASQGYHCDQ